jgi:hypothetical protein
MHARHGVQAAIISTIGYRWLSLHDLVKALQGDGWRLGLIEQQLRYLVRDGVLWMRRDVHRKRFLEAKYTCAREIGPDPLIGTDRRRRTQCAVLSDPVEAFQHADPA